MSVSIYSPPYGEPLSMAEVKDHVKADTDNTFDDASLHGVIQSVWNAAEVASVLAGLPFEHTILVTTFDFSLNGFPYCDGNCAWRGFYHLHVPHVPIVSVASITYVDTAGTTQTLDSSKYAIANPKTGVIALAYGEAWPSTRYQPNAVTVRFTAGLAAVFTAVAATDVCTVQGRTLSDGAVVHLVNSGGTLPGGLAPLTNYYVVSASGATFKLSLTSGGAAIDITSAGSGIHYVASQTKNFQAFRSAMLLHVTVLHERRSAVVIEAGAVVTKLPMAYEALIASAVL